MSWSHGVTGSVAPLHTFASRLAMEGVGGWKSLATIASSDGLAINVFDRIDVTEAVVVTPGTGGLRFGR